MLFLHERILRKESRRRCQNGFKDVLYGQRLTTSWRKVSSSFCQTYLISGISNSNAFFEMDNRDTKKCARTNVIIFLNGTTMTLKTLFLWWALGRNDTNVQTFMFMSFHRIHVMAGWMNSLISSRWRRLKLKSVYRRYRVYWQFNCFSSSPSSIPASHDCRKSYRVVMIDGY